ncbi:hypothetical protein LCGC14_2663160, partial [marine sediment metagenome]
VLKLSEAPLECGQLWLGFEKAVEGYTTDRIYTLAIKGQKIYHLPLEFQKDNKIVRVWVKFPEKMFEWVGN